VTRPSLGLALGDGDFLVQDVMRGIEGSARDLGIDVAWVGDSRSAARRDVVIAVGYPHYYDWLARRLPSTRRIIWIGEPLPPPDERPAARLLRRLPTGRILDRIAPGARIGGRGERSVRLTEWRERAAFDHDRRFNLASHRRAKWDGFDLVVTSADRAASLRHAGIDAAVVPYGYHADLAGPPQPADGTGRDIDVLVLAHGVAGLPTRRVRVLAEVLHDLGPTVRTKLMSAGAFGIERQRELGRARVVLNIHRVPGNFTGIRTVLAGAAGAVIVSEPVDTPAPFVPGVHYLEAPARALAATIHTILDDEPRRVRIATTMQRLLLDELTMARSLEAVLRAYP
jgi:hypothetical protein